MKYNAGNGKINQHKVTHGLRGHYLYDVWRQMLKRCNDTTSKKYAAYGARGISVCPEWYSISVFVADIERLLGVRPKGCSLDRKDNNGNYCPTNVKWSTNVEQCRNTRNNRLVEINGASKTVSEWAEVSGIPYYTLHGRLRRNVSADKLLQPVRKIKR